MTYFVRPLSASAIGTAVLALDVTGAATMGIAATIAALIIIPRVTAPLPGEGNIHLVWHIQTPGSALSGWREWGVSGVFRILRNRQKPTTLLIKNVASISAATGVSARVLWSTQDALPNMNMMRTVWWPF